MKKILKILLLIIFLLIVTFSFYVLDYYKADDIAIDIYNKNDKSLVFKGDKDDMGFIIYPGGKVEAKAYVNLAKLLNDEGYTAIVLDFPFNIGFFGIKKGDSVIEEYSNINNWTLIGHSLGGAVASIYSNDNDSEVDYLVLLASYSTEDLKDNDLKTLTILGENDDVINKVTLEDSKNNYKDTHKEVIIEGGNHAGFGNYGSQKGDGNNTIDNYNQQKITVKEILEFIDN